MTENIDEQSIIKYKTTTMSCQCPDRKHRNGGSLILKGQRVCKHIKALRERCWKRNAERSMEWLYPARVIKRRQAAKQQEEQNEETWQFISQTEAKQKFPIGLKTQQYTDFLRLQTYCQRLVNDLEKIEAHGASDDRLAIPPFIIRAANNIEQEITALPAPAKWACQNPVENRVSPGNPTPFTF